MRDCVYRIHLSEVVEWPTAEALFELSLAAVQALFGESQARLDTGHAMSEEKRKVVIDAIHSSGVALGRIFVGLLIQSFGPDAVRIETNSPRRRRAS